MLKTLDTEQTVALGKAIGAIDENIIKEAQIKRTIRAHLDKELRFRDKGIKVLSLFFIDEVKKYRLPDGAKGIYAEMFERCYNELINKPKYESLKQDFPHGAETIHNGYFFQDKKGAFKDTKGDTIADYDTYNTIMKDKEWLLSYDCPLRFIFSHSALQEGWDNPNVFQICTLIDQKSTFTCRQKVGRGLRLCVDQTGERIEDKNINILHVMANESFSEFADTLQKESEEDTGIKFGTLQISLFSGMVYTETKTVEKTITKEEATKVVEILKTSGAITDEGKVEKSDLVYVLGDMIWKTKNDEAEAIIKSLNVQITLIKGNHDRFLSNAKAKKALAGLKDYDDITVKLADGTDRRCILSHYFMLFYNGHHYQAIHLHGHSHSTEEAKIEFEIAKELNEKGFTNEIYNVGCMYWNYEPVTLDEILKSKQK